MSPLAIGLISLSCIFGGTLLGFYLQSFLPKHHLTKESHEIVKLGAGMIATLTALVLGLLVSSAKNSFDTVNAGIMQGGVKIILLDRVLAYYGPETKAIREQLRRDVVAGIARVWPEDKAGSSSLAALEQGKGLEPVQEQLRALIPQNESQRLLLNQALQLGADFSQTRWLLIEQSQNQLPTTFLVVLISWLTLLFASFGLFAPRNGTVITVLFIGAVSMSAAIFLVMEMNQPLDGVIKVSSAPLRKALEHLGK